MKVYRLEYRQDGVFTFMPTYIEVVAESEEDAVKAVPELKISRVEELTDEYMISMAGSVERYIKSRCRKVPTYPSNGQ